jgi:hypothetical protein
VSKEVRALIFQMVAQNPTWGAPRVHGSLTFHTGQFPFDASREASKARPLSLGDNSRLIVSANKQTTLQQGSAPVCRAVGRVAVPGGLRMVESEILNGQPGSDNVE